MSWKREGDRVTVEMSFDDWERLLMVLGFAAASADRPMIPVLNRLSIFQLVNRLNEGNPSFQQYDLIAEAQKP